MLTNDSAEKALDGVNDIDNMKPVELRLSLFYFNCLKETNFTAFY